MTALKSFINSGAYDVFVAKFDGDDANHFWSHSFGCQNPLRDTAYGHAITVDAEGDFYITGYFSGSLDVGGGTLLAMGSNSIFIAKFKGEDGSHIWSKSLSIKGQNSVYAYSIAVDKKGDIIITGYFSGTLNFGGVALSSTGRKDLFIAKFTGINGSHEWSHRFGGQNSKRDSIKGYSVAIDKNGDLTVTGYFSGTVNIGDKKITSVGGSDFFVAKFKGTDGSKVWVSSFEGTWEDMGKCLTIDPQDNVLITGYFTGTLDFGDKQLSCTGRRDIFLVKFGGADGQYIWSRSFGGCGPNWDSARAYSVAASKSGDLVITGYFNGTLDFGGGPLISKSNNDIFVAKFNGDGDHIWSHNYGGKKTNFAHSYAVSIDSNEDIIVMGDFSGSLDLGGGLLASTAKRDLFVAKYNGADGSHIWSCISRGTWETLSRDVTIDKKGNVLITGFSSGTVRKFKFNIDTNYPVLLFPVRLETRFMDNELWLRIYPDQVSIESHRSDLNEHEKAVNSLYRNAKSDEDKRSAWRVMVQRFGSKRAAWIIRSKDKPDLINVEKKPEYKQVVWGNPPLVRTFPDRFVICLYKGDGCVKKAIGNQIPCELPLMGDPEKEFNGNLFDGDSSWVNDFDRAEKIGMALKIPLDPNEDRHFTRVIAVGIKYSGTSEGQKMLEDLIDNHHYTSGFSFLPYGTPTNNTMNTKSGYSESLDDPDRSYYNECCEGQEEAEIENHNSQVVARAFGLDPGLFRNIENAYINNSPQERELKKVLWPVFGDYFLFFALSSPPSGNTRVLLRNHFTEFVTARGPLPAVGIGDQPYGILPVTRINGWKASGLDGHSKVEFYTKLHAILFELYKKWLDMAIDTELVPRITGDSDDPDDELLQILAMEPTSTSYGIRPVVKEPFLYDFRSGRVIPPQTDISSFVKPYSFETINSFHKGIIEFHVKQKDEVKKGDLLCSVDRHHSRHDYYAPSVGKVLQVFKFNNNEVNRGDSLLTLLLWQLEFQTKEISSNHTGSVSFSKHNGDVVNQGDLLCSVGENEYRAPYDGKVDKNFYPNEVPPYHLKIIQLERTEIISDRGVIKYYVKEGKNFSKDKLLFSVRHCHYAPSDGTVVKNFDPNKVNKGDKLIEFLSDFGYRTTIIKSDYTGSVFFYKQNDYVVHRGDLLCSVVVGDYKRHRYYAPSDGKIVKIFYPIEVNEGGELIEFLPDHGHSTTTIKSDHTGSVIFRKKNGEEVSKGDLLCSVRHCHYAKYGGKVLEIYYPNEVNEGYELIEFSPDHGDITIIESDLAGSVIFSKYNGDEVREGDLLCSVDGHDYRAPSKGKVVEIFYPNEATKYSEIIQLGRANPETIYRGRGIIKYYVNEGDSFFRDKLLFSGRRCHYAPSDGTVLKIYYPNEVNEGDDLIEFLPDDGDITIIESDHTGSVFFSKHNGDVVSKGDLLCSVVENDYENNYLAPSKGKLVKNYYPNVTSYDSIDMKYEFKGVTHRINMSDSGIINYYVKEGEFFFKDQLLFSVRHCYYAPFDGIVSNFFYPNEVKEGDTLIQFIQFMQYRGEYNLPPWIFPTAQAKDIVASINNGTTLRDYTSWSEGLDLSITIRSNHTGKVYFKKNISDIVNKGVPLCSINLNDYYAPFDGKVLQLFKFNNDEVKKGDPLILFGDIFLAKERARSLIKGFPNSLADESIFRGILDLHAHRLDAWLTSFATKRLRAMREREPEGIYIGAYGWLEDLQPEENNKVIEGEFIHAPSADQAAAAAVLRNAYLTQKHSDTSKPYRINLTSDRVRRALRLLDGVREGQELGALLGYLFERGLHDNGMDRYIDEFRLAFPLVANKLTESKAGEAAEAVAARNVVDGLALAEKWEKSEDAVFKLISKKLSDNNITVFNKDKSDLARLIDNSVMDSQDGMADLLFTESMCQLVKGNFERAGAALDAAAGKARPPEIESIQTPISGTGLGHRVCILFNGTINSGQGPRSKAEPRLDAWFGDILGDMNKVGCIAHIKFDFNKATFEGLEILPGIGPEKAKLIITDREKNGDYTQLEDLKRVQGIGESTINELRKIELDPYKFDFNKATFKELEILPGIGPEKAKLIITDREKNGDYTQLGDLKRVQGIGESTINELRKILDTCLVSLKDLDISPLDFLYMSSFPLSYRGRDDSGEPVSEETELEQRMAYFIRKLRNLPACAIVRFDFERASDHFTRSIAEAVELGRTVLDLLGKSSFLRPDSLWLQEDEDTLAQYDIDELFNRVTDAHDSISGLLEHFNMIEKRIVVDFFNGVINPSEIVERIKADPNFLRASSQGYGISSSLANMILEVRNSLSGGTFSSIEEIDNVPGIGPDTMHDILYSLQLPTDNYEEEIIDVLLETSRFGIEGTISLSPFADPELVSRKNNTKEEINERLSKCKKLLDGIENILKEPGSHSKAINVLVKAMKAVFGDGFMVLPTFTAPNPQDLQTIYQDASRIHMWLHQAAQISPALSHLEDTIMACDAWRTRAIDSDSDYSGILDEIVTEAFTLRVAQLPGNGDRGWLALSDDELKKEMTEEEIKKMEDDIKKIGRQKGYLSIVSLVPETIDFSNKLTGLLVHQWQEKIPDKKVDTGLSFYYNQPNSQPPQSLLLAVPGEMEDWGSRWTVDELIDIVGDTMDLARVRIVDPEALQYGGHFPPALFLKTESDKLKPEGWYRCVWRNFLEELLCLDFNTFEVGDTLNYRIIKGFVIYSNNCVPIISSNDSSNYLEFGGNCVYEFNRDCNFILPTSARRVDITVCSKWNVDIVWYDEENRKVKKEKIRQSLDEKIYSFTFSYSNINCISIRTYGGSTAVLKICMRPKEV
jgi:competence ComEA-like helix-hairpin-helix protein